MAYRYPAGLSGLTHDPGHCLDLGQTSQVVFFLFLVLGNLEHKEERTSCV